ncbi:formate/nitrite transporter family protein [Salinirubellus sp. GCM10025818]|uniref:formate/nitrite transporter family protein n=1 Tax=Salinirubellus TaxID=2162630 RepID=UPI0030D499FD
MPADPKEVTDSDAGAVSDDEGEGRQTDEEDILRVQLEEGLSELNRPSSGLFISALSAGLDIGFGPLLMAVVLTTAGFSFSSPVVGELLMANAYALGFVFVVMGRSELFTEHTTLAVLPVLDRQASLAQLGRLWGLVYAGNVVGSAMFAGIIVLIAPALDIAEPRAFVEIAEGFTAYRWPVIVAAGVLAGWLMGLLSWLVAAAQESVSRLLFVWLIATAIGFAHLPHSIAGTVEVLAGVLVSPELTYVDFLRFLGAATVGNALGGSVFVSLLKYSHVVRSGPRPD